MKSSTLLEKLIESFPNTTPPEGDPVVGHSRPDSIKLRNDFQGKKWQEVSNETIANHFDNLPLFTGEAFAYYIPAYIRSVLEQDYAYLTTAEFLIYFLDSPSDEERKLRHEDRMNKFTTEQIGYLISFLEFLSKESQYSRHNKDITLGLEELQKYK